MCKNDRFAWIVLLYVVNIDLVIFRYHHRPSVIDMTTNVYICIYHWYPYVYLTRTLFDMKWALYYEVFVIMKYLNVKFPNSHPVLFRMAQNFQPTVVINLYNLLVHFTTFYADTIETKITTVNHHVPWYTTMYHGQSVL